MLPVMKVPKTACDNISLTHSLTHCLPLMALLPLVMVAYVCALFLPAACHILRTAPLRAANVPRSTKLKGTTSTPSSIMLLIGLARTTMSSGRWSAFVSTISKAPVTMGRLKASSATPTTRTTSSRAPLRQDPQLSRHISPQPACGFFASVHVYLGPQPRRALALDFLHIQQTGRRLF
jgi:hypothetical protein